MEPGSNQAVIDQAKNLAQMGSGRFLNAFRAVPEEKLDWSPAPEGRSAVQIACHLAAVSDRFAALFEGRPAPEGSHFEAGVDDEAQAEKLLR